MTFALKSFRSLNTRQYILFYIKNKLRTISCLPQQNFENLFLYLHWRKIFFFTVLKSGKQSIYLGYRKYKKTKVGTNNIIPKAQRNNPQRFFQPVNALLNFTFKSAAQLPQLTFSFSSSAMQFRNCGMAFSYQVKAQLNFRN